MAAPEQDPFARLETLARDTEELRPTNAFSDAVMAALETKSAATILEKAKRETADLMPTDDFVASVMQSVGKGQGRGESEWNARVVRFSRFALMGAAAAAAFCLWLSIQAESRFDATILEDVAELEVDE